MLGEGPKSKSERKREARGAEDIACELVQLSPPEISKLPCSEDLRQEILITQGIKGHGGRKRQIKYLAKCLRSIDYGKLVDFLDEIKGLRLAETRELHDLERLRNWICRDETGEALEKTVCEFPFLEIGELRDLAERYRRTGQRRFSRDIFQRLKAALDQKKRRGLQNQG